MKYVGFLIFILLMSCANQSKHKIPLTHIEILDKKGVMSVNDRIALSTKSERVIWTLLKVDKNSAVFRNEQGNSKTLFSAGFLPGSFITRFQVQSNGVLFYPHRIKQEKKE